MTYCIGNIRVSTISSEQMLCQIADYISMEIGAAVFTPNVDHVVEAEYNRRFADAYSRASLCLPDGMPLVAASKLSRNPIPKRIAGSDFIYPLLKLCESKNYRVFFIGSDDETIEKASQKLYETMPNLNIVGHTSPKISSEVTSEEVRSIMADPNVRNAHPDVVIVALGAPKQELFIDQVRELGYFPNAIFFGLGATLDFIAGKVQRAPEWIQKSGLEWAYRLYREPKRLARRYARDLQFPFILAKTMYHHLDIMSELDKIRFK